MLKQLRGQITRSIKAIITPHLWKSQYEGTMVFAFSPLDISNRERNTRSMGKVFNRDLKVCQGFYSDGIIDALGHGCACYPFESFCLEDLMEIEKWLVKNFQKELTRRKKYRELTA